MALFGFGRKKQAPAPQAEPVQEPAQVHGPNDQHFIQVNGMWMVNPDYDPSTKDNHFKVKISSSSDKVWSEDVDKFLARNDNAMLVQLTGKPEEFADYSVGNRCYIEEDEENEGKYIVTCGGEMIGRLPASGVAYAKKHDTTPDFLVAIIASAEYDPDKDRDIISIYIAD